MNTVVYLCNTGPLLFIQSLEQDKYSLQQRLDAQRATSDAIQQEFETTCAQLEKKYSQQLKYDEEVHSRKTHEMSKVNSDLKAENEKLEVSSFLSCLLYTSPSPRDATLSRMPSSA